VPAVTIATEMLEEPSEARIERVNVWEDRLRKSLETHPGKALSDQSGILRMARRRNLVCNKWDSFAVLTLRRVRIAWLTNGNCFALEQIVQYGRSDSRESNIQGLKNYG
jgi:hypothetical protein